jgi:TetR/AcrR family transcriptional regulator
MTHWQAMHAVVIRCIASWLYLPETGLGFRTYFIYNLIVMNPKKPFRNRGRPKGTTDIQRSRLLHAAEQLLPGAQDEFSLRQVALRAEVTPPLAHYYFGNRDGLLRALVSERAAPRIEELLAAAGERSSRPVSALTSLMQRLTLLCARDAFLRACLLLPAGEPMRASLRIALTELLQGAQAAGQVRADLAASFVADTLLGLCLFPFVDSGNGNDMVERAAALTLHHVALLQDGLRPRRQQT